KTLENVLDILVSQDIGVYEILVELAETHSESMSLEADDGGEYEVLLMSAPIVAWTRYRLPEGTLSDEQRNGLKTAIADFIAAPGAKISMLPDLVSFDQMPQTFQETRAWLQCLGMQALGKQAEPCPVGEASDMEGMLADARFAIAAVAVPKGQAVFRWQSPEGSALEARDQALLAWSEQVRNVLGNLFTGCQTEILLPDAYYTTNREADRRIRPVALRAAVTWLQMAANMPGPELRAAIVACGTAGVEEFRIGFTPRVSNEVIYGCLWPVLSKEEAIIDSVESNHIDMPEA